MSYLKKSSYGWWKKTMVVFLIITLIVSLSPVSAFADEDSAPPPPQDQDATSTDITDMPENTPSLPEPGGYVHDTLLVENLTSDGDEDVVDENGYYMINSNTKSITGTLSVQNPDEQDWYFKDADGNENQLSDVILSGAFENAEVVSLDVDKDDKSKVNFTIDSIHEQNEIESVTHMISGHIIILADNNCYGKNMVASIDIDQIRFSSKSIITAKSNDENNKDYTIEAFLDGGEIAEALSKDDISFDGTFTGATINGDPIMNEDNKGFTIDVTKTDENIKFGDIHGSLILKPDTLKFANGKLLDEVLSFHLIDPTPTKASSIKATVPQHIASMGVYDTMAVSQQLNDTHTISPEQVLKFISLIKGVPIPALEFFGKSTEALTEFLKLIGVFEDPVQKALKEIKKELDTISAQIKGVSEQLDAATRSIIGEIDKQTLEGRVEKVQDGIYDLDKHFSLDGPAINALDYLTNYDSAKGDLDTNKVGALLSVFNTDAMTADDTDSGNIKYLNDFTDLTKLIAPDHYVGSKSTFDDFEGYSSVSNNWNTQTFESRKAYNEYIYSYYSLHYLILYEAVLYDYTKNVAKLEELEKEMSKVDDLLKANPKAVDDYGKPLSEVKEEQAATLRNLKVRRNYTAVRLNIAVPEERLPVGPYSINLIKQQEQVKEYYEKSNSSLQYELDMKQKGYILSYRMQYWCQTNLGALVARDAVTPYYHVGSLPFNEKSLTGSHGDIDCTLSVTPLDSLAVNAAYSQELLTACRIRRIDMYSDLQSAGFELHWKHDNDFLSAKSRDTYIGMITDASATKDGGFTRWTHWNGYANYIDFKTNDVTPAPLHVYNYETGAASYHLNYIDDKYFIYLKGGW